MRTQPTLGTSAHAPAAAAAAATPSSLRRVDAFDARVKALREEARTGLASSEVRRTLIQEELRQPPRPIPAPPKQPRRTAQPHTGVPSPTSIRGSSIRSSTAVTGAGHLSTHVETTGDDQLPASWLVGTFQLDASPETSRSNALSLVSATISPPTAAASASTESVQASSVDVGAHVSYANALRAYEALCRIAHDVAYDVSYEEGLRRVETRDGDTGLATCWISRRASVPLLHSDALIFNGGSIASVEEPQVGSSHGVSSTPRTASLALYTPPPSSHGATAVFSSSPARGSLCSSHSAARHSPGSRRSTVSKRQLRSVSAVATSSVGTAVVRSSAAHFATALRQTVKAQREQSGVANPRGRLNSISPPSSTAVGDTHAVPEWRTRVAAALTVAVCPSCCAMFEYALKATLMSGVEEDVEAERGVEGADEKKRVPDSTAMCPRCGAAVDVSAATTATAAACRWLPPPHTAAAGSAATASFCSLLDTAKRGSGTEVGHPSSAQRTVTGSAPRSSGSGTDSAGFAERDGEESFAALIARIRASKREAEAHTQSASATKATVSTSTGMAAAAVKTPESKKDASVGSEGRGPLSPQPARSVPSSVLPAAAPLDPMVSKLRAALSHLYFFELMKGGASSKGNMETKNETEKTRTTADMKQRGLSMEV